jgi:hypothetical protein
MLPFDTHELDIQHRVLLDKITHLLLHRERPAIVWITADNNLLQKRLYGRLRRALQHTYMQSDYHLSDMRTASLYEYLSPKITAPDEGERLLIHLFDIESLVTPTDYDPATDFAYQLNFEREMIYKKIPASIIFWSSERAQTRIQKLAYDFWD